MKKKIKVLIIDDSALVRKVLTDLLESDSSIVVIGTASNPYFAKQILKKEIPDVITLDIEMPKMDGLTFLKVLMSQRPIPVVIVSSLTEKSGEVTIKALELGAIDVVKKPSIKGITDFENINRNNFLTLIKEAALINVNEKIRKKTPITIPSKGIHREKLLKTSDKLILIGASTGGTEAIKQILLALPYDCPPVAIVQHMPELYTKSFAKRLNDLCEIDVKEAEHGDYLIPGQALIAPGNFHMTINSYGAQYKISLNDNSLVNNHRPSVDVLFRSAVKYAGKNFMGVILTGMGKDGAKGLLELKDTGVITVAQDELTSVVFGMPKEAIRLGAARYILPLNKIGIMLQQFSRLA